MPEVVNTSALLIDQDETEDNRPVMIDVDHVSMSFNMASEQLNSLKEYALALAKGKLFFEEFKALDDVSFQVRKGDVFGIVGTNGSGKSTLLKIIAGVLEPTRGKCEINGNIAPLIELGAGFDTDLSARENIYLNGALLGYPKEFIDEKFEEIVEFAEVEKFLDMPLKNYSSGMVARIAFAIATVIVPDILIVDEVLSVGDFMFQKKCEDRIKDLIEKHGVTVLIVSHSNDQVARLCNKAIWIEKGHTRLLGEASSACRVYGGLGGRTGSAEAERKVFQALRDSLSYRIPDGRCRFVSGESSSSVNARLVLEGWREGDSDSLVVACDTTHANAVLGAPLASLFNAPVIGSKPDYLLDSTEKVLFALKPKRIFVVDCSSKPGRLVEELSALPWHPELVLLLSEGDVFELSLKIYEYGLGLRLWGEEALVVSFEDNPESMVAAGVAYSRRAPVLMLGGDRLPERDLRDRLVQDGFSSLLLVGSLSGCAEVLSGNGLAVSTTRGELADEAESLILMAQLMFDDAQDEPAAICVAPRSMSQWSELLSAGPYCARTRSSLLLVNSDNLDNFQAALDFIGRQRGLAKALVFVGGHSGLDEKLLCSCLEAGEMTEDCNGGC